MSIYEGMEYRKGEFIEDRTAYNIDFDCNIHKFKYYEGSVFWVREPTMYGMDARTILFNERVLRGAAEHFIRIVGPHAFTKLSREEVGRFGSFFGRYIEPNADLQGVKLIGVMLTGAKLRYTNFQKAILRDTDFRGADLRDTDFRLAALKDANFEGAYLNRADLRRARLYDTNLIRADLRQVDLRDTNLAHVRFNLSLDPRIDRWSETNLWNARLQQAFLAGVNLKNAILEKSYLMKASLQEADLSRANLRRADLSGADLSGTNLSGADLRGAILLEVREEDKANFTGAKYDSETKADIDLSERGAIYAPSGE